jgi:glycosyltransferase involved in cell wall biosynthesis
MSYNDIQGGANIASFRLFQSLNKANIDTKIYCCNKKAKTAKIFTYDTLFFKITKTVKAKLQNILNIYYKKVSNENNLNPMISLNIMPSNWAKKINSENFDIVNLHWVGNEMMSINDIGNIKKKILWTLHDCWPFQSIEHYPTNKLKNYLNKVRYKNTLNSLENFIYKKKIKNFKQIRNIVAPSNWMANIARKSRIFKSAKIKVIPNPLDTNIFKPLDQNFCTKHFNLEKKKIILFGSAAPLDNPAKNFNAVINTINNLYNSIDTKDIQLVLYGSYNKTLIKKIKLSNIHLGFINDVKKLAMLYNSADVLLHPSKIDNLPQTAIESIACGTPVISYNVGGMKDIIDHNLNGYLIKPFAKKDYLDCLIEVLKLKKREKNILRNNGRQKALKLWSEKSVTKKYIEVYKEILDEK